jgi:soluble lytic murein transglycosylase-like protein
MWKAQKYLSARSNSYAPLMNKIDYWYGDIIDKAHARYPNVSKKMIASLIAMESSGRKFATSSAGAQGLMQLMPDTQKETGVSDPYNPTQNIMGGTKYMSKLLKHYHNDADKSLAAYNEGMTKVDKNGLNSLPSETENYIEEYHGIQQ